MQILYFSQNENIETSHRGNFHALVVEDKNIFFTLFSYITAVAVKWLYKGSVIFQSMFYNLHSFGLLLRSSRPEVFFKKFALKSFAKCTGKHLCQRKLKVVFLRKLQDACYFINKETPDMCFPVIFPKFSGAMVLQNITNGHLLMFSVSWFLRKENIKL